MNFHESSRPITLYLSMLSILGASVADPRHQGLHTGLRYVCPWDPQILHLAELVVHAQLHRRLATGKVTQTTGVDDGVLHLALFAWTG